MNPIDMSSHSPSPSPSMGIVEFDEETRNSVLAKEIEEIRLWGCDIKRKPFYYLRKEWRNYRTIYNYFLNIK